MKVISKLIKLFLVLYLVHCCSRTNAQSVNLSGTVTDRISQQPLPDATIKITSINNKNFSNSTITNNKGSFLIPLPAIGLYKIEVSYLGYENYALDSVLVAAKNKAVQPIYLSLANKNLKAVTVNTNTKKPFISIAPNKITLNIAESPVAAGSNVYEVLTRAPGVMEQNDALTYRGKSLSIYINGRPSHLSGEDLKTMLTNMQASGIEKIEILPNPSSKYDANGAAVVNIVLAKNKQYGTNYILTGGLGYGKDIRGNAGLDFNNRSKDVNIYGGYNFNHNTQYYKTNSIRYLTSANLSSDEYEERERNNHTYKLGIDYDINKHSSFGGLINGSLNYRNRTVTNNSKLHYFTNTVDSSSNVATTGQAIISNPTLNLYYKTTLDTMGKEFTLNADYMNYNKSWQDNFTNNFYNAKSIPYLPSTFLKDNSPANINVYSLSADWVLPYKKYRLEAGLKSAYTITDNNIVWQDNNGLGWINDPTKTNHFIYKENVNAAYLNYIQTIKKFNIEAGIRAEQTNTLGNSVTLNQENKISYIDFFPNISLNYTKDANHVFGASFRKSIYRFGLNVVNPFIIYQNQYSYSEGNPNIEPEIYHSMELSYTYKQAYTLSVDYMHGVKTLGAIYLSAPNSVTISSYANYNSSDMFYVSASLNKTIAKIWSISINPMYGYISLKNGVENISSGSAKNIWVGQLQWSNRFSFKKGWNAELSLMYISPFQYGSYTTHTMFNTDFGIAKAIMKNKASLKLGVSDIFNTLNYDKEVNYENVICTIKYKPESRFINLTFRYKFGNKNVKGRYQKQSKISDLQNRIQ